MGDALSRLFLGDKTLGDHCRLWRHRIRSGTSGLVGPADGHPRLGLAPMFAPRKIGSSRFDVGSATSGRQPGVSPRPEQLTALEFRSVPRRRQNQSIVEDFAEPFDAEQLAMMVAAIKSGASLFEPWRPADQGRAAAQACPTCGAPMVARTALRGSRSGEGFLGCSAYPRCWGVRPLQPEAVAPA